MLTEKPWKMDAVLLLVSGLMLSLATGAALSQLLFMLAPAVANAHGIFLRFLISTFSFQGVGLILINYFLKLHDLTWRDLLGLDRFPWQRAVALGLGIGLTVLPLALLLNLVSFKVIELVFKLKPEGQAVVAIVEKSVGLPQRICIGIAAIVLAPIVEETLFRGILYPLIKQRGHPRLALLASSFLFGAIHLNLLTFLPLLFLAVVLVYLYERTDTLLAPICAHALFNAINFFLLLYLPKPERLLGIGL